MMKGDDDGNMEMVGAAEIIGVGQEVTPPLSPLSYSLHHSFVASHCSSCFSSLPPHPFPSQLDHHPPLVYYYYCSSQCSSFHSPLYLSSAAQHLSSPTSDLCLALLLLLQIKRSSPSSYHRRICGLITNRHKLLNDNHHDFSSRIKNGARAMAAAISLRDHRTLDSDYLLEEALLCLVITNAVEVQDRIGQSVGIALYNISFSWINHSCSPNACYRFLPPHTHSAGQQQSLIMPKASSSNGRQPLILTGLEELCGGPRLVVRSIKPIKKGEQVTIAYTDVLQPKDLRQSELWSKYRFTCRCHRCVAVPLTFVDQRLQEICVSNGRMLQSVGLEKFTEYIDDAIDDYLSSNDAESCCKKLEDALLNGFHYEQLIIRLHPQNRLSLNAYTTLASAYKVHAIAMEDDDAALKMTGFSAAYSFLLALATHHLFLDESCLIVSVSNFWVGAGESLLNLATSLVVSPDIPKSCSKCCSKCGLIDMFKAKFFDLDKVFEISKEFLDCITDITPKVWKFLVHGNGFLEAVKDPGNLGWFETINSVANNKGNVKALIEDQERVELFRLGFHCLLYGGILSNISGGHDSYLSCSVQHLLYDG